jgi:hypothetical protein
MNVLSPFNKIQFESYSLSTESGYDKLVKRVFGAAKVENNNTSATIPFPLMSRTETEVWKAYCPEQRKLSEAASSMHVEALKLIETYADKFDWMEIWSESGDQIDPALVGHQYRDADSRKNKYSWSVNRFILCRWGEALKPITEIKQLVYDAHIRRERIRIQKDLNNLEFEAMERFGL